MAPRISRFLLWLFEPVYAWLWNFGCRQGLILGVNTELTISKITNEALMVLENSLTFTMCVNRDYDDQYAVVGAKIGDTVNVRRPVRVIGTTGPNDFSNSNSRGATTVSTSDRPVWYPGALASTSVPTPSGAPGAE